MLSEREHDRRTELGPIPWNPALSEDGGDEERRSDAGAHAASAASGAPRADDPSDLGARSWKEVMLRVKDEMKNDHLTLTAAGVAFFFFTALVPLLGAAISMYGLVADPADVVDLVDSLGPAVPDALKDLIEEQLDTVATANSSALGIGFVIGLLAGIWSASSGFGHLVEGLNVAYDEDEGRTFVKRKALALGLTLGFFLLLGLVTLVITTATGFTDGALSVVVLAIGWVVVAVLLALFLAVLYRYGPNRDEPEWVWVSPGSMFAVVAWTLLSIAFGVYVSRFGSYNETYGSLGAIVVILTWMYLTAVVVMLGAEITTELERQTAHDTTIGEPEPIGQRDAAAADEVVAGSHTS